VTMVVERPPAQTTGSQQPLADLLRSISPTSRISRSAYDTAWIARLSALDEPMGYQALDWLRENQRADGSWGANELRYYHERLICTLAAMIALAHQRDIRDYKRIQRAQSALEVAARGLLADPAGSTIGFEMIVPTLLDEAKSLGIIRQQSFESLNKLGQYRAAKLASLPSGMINRAVTVAFSSEMVGKDGLHLLDLSNLQEGNGSIAYSPAATVFYLLNINPHDKRAMDYLRQVTIKGSAPYIAPIEVFESGWALWNLARIPYLDSRVLALCQPHLDLLESEWIAGKGISACAQLTLIDGDSTGLVYETLTHFGRQGDFSGVLDYEVDEHFRCFRLEANPSISTNVHILGALRAAGLGLEHPSVRKALRFLERSQTMRLFWFDKWQASPYYTTSHAIMVCAGFADSMVEDAVYWILETQNDDGSWGYYLPTAEETAYCLQALVTWKQQGRHIPMDAVKRGVDWLSTHSEPPYPPLWIGKALYCPEIVVRSAILSALTMVEQEFSVGV
jgi:halimadienyl-diphosphate synthase